MRFANAGNKTREVMEDAASFSEINSMCFQFKQASQSLSNAFKSFLSEFKKKIMLE